MRARGALLITGGVFAAALAFRISVMLDPGSWWAALPWPIIRLSEFVIGMGLARAILMGWRVRIAPLWCYLGGAAFIAFLVLAPRIAPDHPIVRFVLGSANE